VRLVTVRLIDVLNTMAAEEGATRSDVIRRLLEKALWRAGLRTANALSNLLDEPAAIAKLVV
jgi:hypothetical protein